MKKRVKIKGLFRFTLILGCKFHQNDNILLQQRSAQGNWPPKLIGIFFSALTQSEGHKILDF